MSASLHTPLQRVDHDLDEVLAVARSTCDQVQGAISRQSDPERELAAHGEREERRWVKYLEQGQRIGQFSCTRPDGSIAFELLLRPGPTEPVWLPYPGWHWRFQVLVADQSLRDGFMQRHRAYLERVAALRQDAGPGALVQIPRQLLPAEPAPGMERLRGTFVCAMVISRNGALVQVQVRTSTLYVQLTQVFPRAADATHASNEHLPNVAYCGL